MKKIYVIDGQGGGMGKSLVERLVERLPEYSIVALGTNGAATAAMLKAGAHQGATGENAILWNVQKAKIITGAIGILCANAMMGEISPAIAAAVASSPAEKFLLPLSRCNLHIATTSQHPLPYLMDCTVKEIQEYLGESSPPTPVR